MSVHLDGDHHFLVMKGAPERILQKCMTYLDNGEQKTIDEPFLKLFDQAYIELGGKGERVLGKNAECLTY